VHEVAQLVESFKQNDLYYLLVGLKRRSNKRPFLLYGYFCTARTMEL
jgi:hypothetical protein